MKKKLLTMACATCVLMMSVVGCASKTSDGSSVSANTATPTVTDAVVENTESTGYYSPDIICAQGYTAVIGGSTKTFSVNDTTYTSTVYKGDSSQFVDFTEEQLADSNNFDDLTFYIFNNDEDAAAVMEYLRTTVDPADTDDNYVAGTMLESNGITVKTFYLLAQNMIIERTDYIGDPDDGDKESDKHKTENKIRHSFIMSYYY